MSNPKPDQNATRDGGQRDRTTSLARVERRTRRAFGLSSTPAALRHTEGVKQLNESAGAVGLAMGMFFLIVGMIIDSMGVAALGVVVILTGLWARSTQH